MPNNQNNQKKYASLSTLQTFLDNLKTTFSAFEHKHTLSDITDYKVDSELSSTSAAPVQNKVLNAEFDEIAVSMRALETALDGKSDSGHIHAGEDITYGTVSADRLPKASASESGIVNTGSQTFKGWKRFTHGIISEGEISSDGGIEADGVITANAGISLGSHIANATTLTNDLGSPVAAFANTYAKNVQLYGSNTQNHGGYFRIETEGTTTTEGRTKLRVGNNTAKGNNSNSTGYIEVCNANGNVITLQAPSSADYNYTVTLPTEVGTIATTCVATQSKNGLMSKADKIKLDGAASVATMTTAEYNALSETNANTLYILTDAEEDELITVEDIDAICGATV